MKEAQDQGTYGLGGRVKENTMLLPSIYFVRALIPGRSGGSGKASHFFVASLDYYSEFQVSQGCRIKSYLKKQGA